MPYGPDVAIFQTCIAIFNQRTFYETALTLERENEEIRNHSGNRLKLGDPFSLPISANRQFDHLNENAFSDWLAWVLQVACTRTPDPLLLCEALFSSGRFSTKDLTDGSGEIPVIERESTVPEGHPGHKGRLDVLIHFKKAKRTWHIEAKVSSPENSDLGKHDGYVRFLNPKYPDCNHILLVTTHSKENYDGFRPLRWLELCQRIRSWVAQGKSATIADAMLLLFCGIVEQKLVGMNAGTLSEMKYLIESMGDK